jgi:hypothetical protein
VGTDQISTAPKDQLKPNENALDVERSPCKLDFKTTKFQCCSAEMRLEFLLHGILKLVEGQVMLEYTNLLAALSVERLFNLEDTVLRMSDLDGPQDAWREFHAFYVERLERLPRCRVI